MYKFVVVSDIHHDIARLERIMPVINAADYLIFCGDGMTDIMEKHGEILVPTVCARGNNDIYSHVSDISGVTFGTTHALVTHGHRLGVKQSLSALLNLARCNNSRLVFFGHTHVFYDRIIGGVHLINPGALFAGSYAMVVGDGKNFTCKQCFV